MVLLQRQLSTVLVQRQDSLLQASYYSYPYSYVVCTMCHKTLQAHHNKMDDFPIHIGIKPCHVFSFDIQYLFLCHHITPGS
jgi:hypothetical protein